MLYSALAGTLVLFVVTVSSVGAMLIAASVTISGLGYVGTDMTKAWLVRRPVRSPVAEETTALISSSVCKLPYINASARADRTSSTALAGAARASATSSIG